DITSMMDAEREKVIYLRIARRAAIDGLTELSAFASAKAEQGRDGIHNDDDPRALLYSSLSTVTSDTIEDVRAKLGKIDRGKWSASDRALLDAAQAIAGEVVAPPASLAAANPAPAPVVPAPEPEAAAVPTT
ncbi:chemotaxis protein MotC, partial [Mesorhizobium sp. M2E.F.Ca.ET.154.01.1.1]